MSSNKEEAAAAEPKDAAPKGEGEEKKKLAEEKKKEDAKKTEEEPKKEDGGEEGADGKGDKEAAAGGGDDADGTAGGETGQGEGGGGAAVAAAGGGAEGGADAVDSTVPEAAPTAAAEADDDRSRRVYVGNLAWSVTWYDLKDHMRSTGLDVVRATVLTSPHDGRSRGCGIVEFADAEMAERAVTDLSDTELKGRQIFVREDREQAVAVGGGGGNFGGGGGGGPSASGQHSFSYEADSQSRRVYVGNLSWDCRWQELKDHMKMAGDVIHAEVIVDPHTYRSRGCGVVEFATEDQARAAIDTLSGTDLKGRTIFVREDREKTRSVNSTMSGGGAYHQQQQHNHGLQNPSVYVWNLSPATSWQDLKDHMRQAGNVSSATVFPVSAAVDPSLNAGAVAADGGGGGVTNAGIVVYQKPHDASRAIRELGGSQLNGYVINVREDRRHNPHHVHGRGGGGGGGGGGYRGSGGGRFGGAGGGGGYGVPTYNPRERPEPGTSVFVGNLHYEVTWRELKEMFQQCGSVRRAEAKKGFGFVVFERPEDAERAIHQLNGTDLYGRQIDVKIDHKNV